MWCIAPPSLFSDSHETIAIRALKASESWVSCVMSINCKGLSFLRPCLGDLPWTSAPTRSEINTERVMHGLFPLDSRLTKWLSSPSLWTGSWCCTPTRPSLHCYCFEMFRESSAFFLKIQTWFLIGQGLRNFCGILWKLLARWHW